MKNNTPLINFWLSSDAEILLLSTGWAYKSPPNAQRRVCNAYMFQRSFHIACHRWWLGFISFLLFSHIINASQADSWPFIQLSGRSLEEAGAGPATSQSSRSPRCSSNGCSGRSAGCSGRRRPPRSCRTRSSPRACSTCRRWLCRQGQIKEKEDNSVKLGKFGRDCCMLRERRESCPTFLFIYNDFWAFGMKSPKIMFPTYPTGL